MSKSEILAELPRLKADERHEILEHLWRLEEASLLQGAAPQAEDVALLDRELAAFEQDKDTGAPWREVLRKVRDGGTR